jgi:hypothetical protein
VHTFTARQVAAGRVMVARAARCYHVRDFETFEFGIRAGGEGEEMPFLSFWCVGALGVAWVSFTSVYFLLKPLFFFEKEKKKEERRTRTRRTNENSPRG